MLHDVYPLHRLLEDSSMKSYGEEKTHLNSTNNIWKMSFHPQGMLQVVDGLSCVEQEISACHVCLRAEAAELLPDWACLLHTFNKPIL